MESQFLSAGTPQILAALRVGAVMRCNMGSSRALSMHQPALQAQHSTWCIQAGRFGNCMASIARLRYRHSRHADGRCASMFQLTRPSRFPQLESGQVKVSSSHRRHELNNTSMERHQGWYMGHQGIMPSWPRLESIRRRQPQPTPTSATAPSASAVPLT